MKITKKLISIILTVCLLTSAFSFSISGEASAPNPDAVVASLQIAAVSDIHYYPQSYTGDNCPAWQEFSASESKEYEEADALTRAALDSIALKAKENGTKFLFIPGDLTKDSEYEGHVQLAKILEDFEKDTGIEVFVTNGNHDINNQKACTFENGVKESARCITQAEFKEVYKNLGFDLAYDVFTPPRGSSQGGLSYAVKLDDSYSLIVIDSCKYDAVNPGKDQTDGMVSDELMAWIIEKAEESIASGRTPLAMMHHSVAPHMKLEPSVTFAFCVDDYLSVAEQMADAGIHYVFTGHLHTNDIASVTSDSGETIYDCEVGALSGFPNQIREMKINTYASGESDMSFSLLDVDYAHEINVGDKTYEKPFSKASFAINYGGKFSEDGNADVVEFFMGIIKSFLLPYAEDISAAGGINPFLKDMGIDLDEIIGGFLEPYIGSGVYVGGVKLFTTDNIMWFIDDLFAQIETLYLTDSDKLLDLLEGIVVKLAEFKVSDVPCTKFIEEYGFGDSEAPGTLGDFIMSALYYWYSGNEDISDDLFIRDALNGFENGDTAQRLFDMLLDIIFEDLVDDALLSKLNIRLGSLFNYSSSIGNALGTTVDSFIAKVLKGDTSYKNLVDLVFDLGVLPYSSLFDILDTLLIKEYLTDSQLEAIGAQIAYCAGDFVTDENPQHMGDYDVTYSTLPVTPVATSANYRLPTMLSVTLGEDSTSAYINWFSKSTVAGSDIEIYPENDFSGFTGVPTTGGDFSIKAEAETVIRTYPGIDFGIIGLFNYDFEMNRHTVTLSELEAGTKYYYRVGDAEKGWWSETGTVETPDGSNSVTFFHMSDPQSQNEKQYEAAWAKVVDTAFLMYPDAKFIINTGDLVDHGTNSNQWQWMFDTAAENLMKTYLMPVTGNHEEKGDNSTVNNFRLPNVPTQDTATGVYYSFDYNSVHISVLNTNDLDENEALSKAQIDWLTSDVAASDAQWKFVALHKAIYSNGSHYDDDDVCALRDQLSVLMPQLGIDMVFQGHDHVYLRTYSMDSNLVTDSRRSLLGKGGETYIADVQPTGTTYVISGTSGVKTYLQKSLSQTDEYFPRAEVTVDADYPIFSAIQIEDGVLYFDSYMVKETSAEKIDSFAIQKDESQGEYLGDWEDVSAEDKNKTPFSLFDFFLNLLETFSKILTAFSRIFGYFFG